MALILTAGSRRAFSFFLEVGVCKSFERLAQLRSWVIGGSGLRMRKCMSDRSTFCMHGSMQCAYIYIYIYIHTRTKTHKPVCVCVSVCKRVHVGIMHACARLHACIKVHMHTCVYARMYVCMYAWMYVCTYLPICMHGRR